MAIYSRRIYLLKPNTFSLHRREKVYGLRQTLQDRSKTPTKCNPSLQASCNIKRIPISKFITLPLTESPSFFDSWKALVDYKYISLSRCVPFADLRFRVHSYGAKDGGGATMTALVHEQNRYTSGVIHSFRFEPGRKYYLTVFQVSLLIVSI